MRGAGPRSFRPPSGPAANYGGPPSHWGVSPPMNPRMTAQGPMHSRMPNFNGNPQHQGGFSGPPRFTPRGGAPMGGPPMPNHEGYADPPQFSPESVMAWIEVQHPMLVGDILRHCQWVLEQQGVPASESDFGPPDMSGWYAEAAPSGMKRPPGDLSGPLDAKRGRHPGLGWPRHQGPLQWTPSGWVHKDNSHKVTTTMKPLPEPEVIPPNGSSNYPEAAADRDKLKMLTNNVNLMQLELTKICKTFKISDFQKEKISTYPEEAQKRLQTAVTCVEKAEQTLAEFKDFLKTEKYKEWNEEQAKKHDEAVKKMIGDMPSGIPHNSRQLTKNPSAESSTASSTRDEPKIV